MGHDENWFRATVTVDCLVDADKLDEEDREIPILADGGARVYLVRASDADAAANAALDHFHDHLAIAMLEDFDIDAEAVPLSAHEIVALTRTYPQLGHASIIEIE